MVTILKRELEHKVEKVQSAYEVWGHMAEDQKQYEFPAWINHNWSVHVNCLWRIRMEGGGEGGVNNFSLTSEKGGGGLLERGRLIEYLRYFIRDSDMN